ncbi:sulfite exporter TauE/SafE family protein [Cyanobacterium aponinum]|uniref:Probable membrane transporter protein n=1 Tax=Cyanobacterium aponinum 0216 TaxID=2676140 RepID=A0A844GP32_9CHRO|nr:sulfite exporter TauE/SafE family protein [Cyanobacterium aponinum]MTF38227.1 TSUP family transporter [Cyanobacterium aponinum 0216]
MRYTIALFLAVLVGLSLGLIGGGGSILAVPILKYVVGVTAKEAIAMSLFIVGIVSIVGLIPHWQQKNVNLPVALSFIPPAMIGAFLGSKITTLSFITDTIQLVSFAIIMLLASILMIKKSSKKNKDKKEENSRKITSKNKIYQKIILTTFQGFGVGVLTGFVGVGGGFLIIPCLVLVGGIPMKEAVGTSLLIIATNSASAFLGYLNQVELNWFVMITFSLFASLGIIIGAKLSQTIEAKSLQKAFGYFVLVVAVFILIVR